MALPSCPKCEWHYFEIKTIEPAGSNFKENAVQCRKCGTVVGVVEYYNSGTLLKGQEKEIAKLQRQMEVALNGLNTINENIRKLARLIQR